MKMTQEEKDLLIKDLCARLPYVTYYDLSHYGCETRAIVEEFIALKNPLKGLVKTNIIIEPILYENIKPYLRPMSSMTEEERNEWMEITHAQEWLIIGNLDKATDWLNKNHFDYRGLIPMGLALEATKDMYKTE